MNETSKFERRLAALIDGYAERAPTDVDPGAMTRLAATGAGRVGVGWLRPTPLGRASTILLVGAALLVTLLGGLLFVGGGESPVVRGTPSMQPSLQASPQTSPQASTYVHDVLGLPPVGATPSLPEKGQLVLAHRARPGLAWPSSGAAPTVFLYADGRLITVPEPAGAYLPEQRLTPAGIEAMRAAVLETGLFDTTRYIDSVEGFMWGSILVRNGQNLVEVRWGFDPPEGSDATLAPALSPNDVSVVHELHDRLIEPSSWLRPEAWAVSEARPFVPSYFSVCLADWSAQALPAPSFSELPDAAQRFLDEHGDTYGVESWPPEGCRSLTTDDTRTFVALLDTLGFQARETRELALHWAADDDRDLVLLLGQMLPHGEPLCGCG